MLSYFVCKQRERKGGIYGELGLDTNADVAYCRKKVYIRPFTFLMVSEEANVISIYLRELTFEANSLITFIFM